MYKKEFPFLDDFFLIASIDDRGKQKLYIKKIYREIKIQEKIKEYYLDLNSKQKYLRPTSTQSFFSKYPTKEVRSKLLFFKFRYLNIKEKTKSKTISVSTCIHVKKVDITINEYNRMIEENNLLGLYSKLKESYKGQKVNTRIINLEPEEKKMAFNSFVEGIANSGYDFLFNIEFNNWILKKIIVAILQLDNEFIDKYIESFIKKDLLINSLIINVDVIIEILKLNKGSIRKTNSSKYNAFKNLLIKLLEIDFPIVEIIENMTELYDLNPMNRREDCYSYYILLNNIASEYKEFQKKIKKILIIIDIYSIILESYKEQITELKFRSKSNKPLKGISIRFAIIFESELIKRKDLEDLSISDLLNLVDYLEENPISCIFSFLKNEYFEDLKKILK
jgi:hypothetical protein